MKTFDKRKFNGKTYTHFNYYRKKSNSNKVKQTLKEQGTLVRSVTTKSKYQKGKKLHHLYIRRK